MKFVLLVILLALWILYFPLNRRKSKYYWASPLDKLIPAISVFVIPYISFLFYVPLSLILLWKSPVIYPFLISQLLATAAASIFWFLFPNGVRRPPLPNKDPLSRLVNYTYRHDRDTNGFPSSHVFSTLICSYFLIQVYPHFLLSIAIAAILISSSTLFTKQHYAIDIFGGYLLAFTSIHILR